MFGKEPIAGHYFNHCNTHTHTLYSIVCKYFIMALHASTFLITAVMIAYILWEVWDRGNLRGEIPGCQSPTSLGSHTIAHWAGRESGQTRIAEL